MGILDFLKKPKKTPKPEQAPVPAPEPVKEQSQTLPEWGVRPENMTRFEEALWTAVDKALKGEVNELHIMNSQKEWSNYRFNDKTNRWEADYTPEQWNEYLAGTDNKKEKEPGSPEKFKEDIEKLRRTLENNTAHYQYAAVSAHDTGTNLSKDNIGLIYRNPEILQAGISAIENRIAISEGIPSKKLLNLTSLKPLATAISRAAEQMDILPLLTSVSIYSGEKDKEIPDIPFNEYSYYGKDDPSKNGVVTINIDNVIDRSIELYVGEKEDFQKAVGHALMENICREMLQIRNKDIYSGNRQMTLKESNDIAKEIAKTQEFRNMPLFVENAPQTIIKKAVGDIGENDSRDEHQHTQKKDEKDIRERNDEGFEH